MPGTHRDRVSLQVDEERPAIGTEAGAGELADVQEVPGEGEDLPRRRQPPEVRRAGVVFADEDPAPGAHREVVRTGEHVLRRRLEDERERLLFRHVPPDLAQLRVAPVRRVEVDAPVRVPAALEPGEPGPARLEPLRPHCGRAALGLGRVGVLDRHPFDFAPRARLLAGAEIHLRLPSHGEHLQNAPIPQNAGSMGPKAIEPRATIVVFRLVDEPRLGVHRDGLMREPSHGP